jgi:hypothetical protein
MNLRRSRAPRCIVFQPQNVTGRDPPSTTDEGDAPSFLVVIIVPWLEAACGFSVLLSRDAFGHLFSSAAHPKPIRNTLTDFSTRVLIHNIKPVNLLEQLSCISLQIVFP